MSVIRENIIKLYIAMFQRIPSKEEIDYWYSSADKNGLIKDNKLNVVKLANTMIDAAINSVKMYHLEDIYPQYVDYNPDNIDSVKNVINSIYQTIFNKNYIQDPAGVQYWTDKIIKDGNSLGKVVVTMENVAEDLKNNPDKYKNIFTPEELQEALKAVDAFNLKVQAVEKISEDLPNVKIDSKTLDTLQNLIKDIYNDNSEEQVIIYIEEHKSEFINGDDYILQHDNNDNIHIDIPQIPSLGEDNSELVMF